MARASHSSYPLPTPSAPPRPYWNPYLVGVLLGLVLLASFVIMGRGLGASGAFSSALTAVVAALAPEHAAANPVYASFLNDGEPLIAWLVFLVAGLFVGALASGLLARRARFTIEKGPDIPTAGRLVLAFAGGVLMAVGAKLAGGCTSGQALTGGALLNVGSWVFMLMVFAGGYAVAYFFRRQWN